MSAGNDRAGGVLDLAGETMSECWRPTVIYMVLAIIQQPCARRSGQGLPPGWPAGVEERGTLPQQRVLSWALTTLPQQVADNKVISPALVIVGEVVRHRVISSPL